jgi:hypothetical protein
MVLLIQIRVYFITMPFKPISLNDYKTLHFGRIKKEIESYKSIIDIVMITVIKKIYLSNEVTEDGLQLKDSLFDDKIDIKWILTFKNNIARDPSNYTQKMMLDALTRAGVLVDDSERYVYSDHTMFGCKQFESITCVMLGPIKTRMIKMVSMPDIKYKDLLLNLEVVGQG